VVPFAWVLRRDVSEAAAAAPRDAGAHPVDALYPIRGVANRETCPTCSVRDHEQQKRIERDRALLQQARA
jgi:hypothetical protein